MHRIQDRDALLKLGYWFFILNSVILILIASKYSAFFGLTFDPLELIYFFILTISHFAAISLLGFLIFILLIYSIPSQRLALLSSAILASITEIILYLDTMIFSLYRMHLNVFTIELFFGPSGRQIYFLHKNQYVQIALGSTIVFLCYYLIATRWFQSKMIDSSFRVMRNSFLGLLMLIALTHGMHAWAFAKNYTPILAASRYYPLYFPTVANDLLLRLGWIKKEDLNFPSSLHSSNNMNLQYPIHPLNYDHKPRYNIVFILIDSWRYLSFDSVVMPNLYAFSKESEVYRNHYIGL